MKARMNRRQEARDNRGKKEFYTEQDLAHRWGTSLQHVRKLRYNGTGPEITWLGRSVRYKFHHIRVFERANTFKSRSAKDMAA